MAYLQARLDLTGLSITGVQTVTVTTYDVYGVGLQLATLTQDFTGYTVSEFINAVRNAIVNTGEAVAYNESPTLRITLLDDIEIFEQQQVDLVFGSTRYSASWIKIGESGCAACYPVRLLACYGSYLIDLGLEANTIYNVVFTDKFGKEYIGQVTSGADGVLTIDPSVYPEGFFTPQNGPITLTIRNAAYEAVSFTVGYTQYDCADIVAIDFESV